MTAVKVALLLMILVVGGCTNIPPQSVELNQQVSAGINSIHESNINFVNQYFSVKKTEVDKFEAQALDGFFDALAAASSRPDAPKLEKSDFEKIKQQIDRIHAQGNSYRNELERSRLLVVEALQANYNILISANNSVTGILQSAVDIEQARSDGLSDINTLSKGKINLTTLDSKISQSLEKMGTTSGNAIGVFNAVQSLLNPSSGEP